MSKRINLNRQLNEFDVTNLVVGSIIGADIYVAAALGAKLVGPISLFIWFIAGLMAIVIALSFSYSAAMMPKVGGPYAYVKEGFGPMAGFMVGWSMLLAEWFSLSVFPVAFTRYLSAIFSWTEGYVTVAIKAVFVAIILLTNIYSIKSAGKFNDYLTIGKIFPLLMLMGTGLLFMGVNAGEALSNFMPFMTGDATNMGRALVLIFWAYAGFELSTLPADEISEPQKTIPRAIVIGMLIVTVFYMTTNFVIIGVVDQQTLAASEAPLVLAGRKIFSITPALSLMGGMIVNVGALISIMGADESGTIGSSRLAYALSIDGYFPRAFSRLHPTYQTPYIGLIILCGTAFVASVIGSLTELINASVFLLSFSYLGTCLSTLRLERKRPEVSSKLMGRTAVPALGVLFSLILMSQVDLSQILTSLSLLGVGMLIYVFFSPKREIEELKLIYNSRDETLKRAYRQGELFLAHLLRHIKWRFYKRKKIERAWYAEEDR